MNGSQHVSRYGPNALVWSCAVVGVAVGAHAVG
jgi:hypothetical protein